ncbi:MAG: hypothetical protein R6U19_01420 [Bacteroidales bacterium]
MENKKPIYHAKILLFGEYSVITKSMAITIPYGHFHGELNFLHEDKYTDLEQAYWSNAQLNQLLVYLQKLSRQDQLQADMELQRLAEDISKGLYFESTIPQGYGIGSSGALVAAVYQRYANPAIRFHHGMEQETLNTLMRQFAQIESFYHGTSSGIDPLNSYAKVPLLIKNMQTIQAVRIPSSKHFSKGGIFLLDTGNPGKTEPLVNAFMKSINSNTAGSIDKTELNRIVNAAINSLISTDTSLFFQKLKILSAYQYHYFSAMIPRVWKGLWKQGLETGDFFLKLCGSGGGGFLLGFTDNFQKLEEVNKKAKINYIPVFSHENKHPI